MVVYIIYINDERSSKISDNEIYLLNKYIKSVLWRVAKCLSYIEEARCVKVNQEMVVIVVTAVVVVMMTMVEMIVIILRLL